MLAEIQLAVAFPQLVATAKGSLVPGSEAQMEQASRRNLPDGLSVEDGRLVRVGMVGRGGGSTFRFWSLWISLVET